jgi:hypothetical protein
MMRLASSTATTGPAGSYRRDNQPRTLIHAILTDHIVGCQQ